MRILISNDDGVNARGIQVLAQALSSLGDSLKDIHVVAPDRDKSAASNSLTIENPLRVVKLENGHFAVNGTPTDCVHLAITSLLPEKPDMVVSGINAGANLGDDVLYSGTVAAAIEGRFLGYPTIAVSLVSRTHEYTHYETAGAVAAKLVKKLICNQANNPLSKDIILNVNVPDVPLSEIKGFKIARLGYRHRAEQMLTTRDPRGNTLYWVGTPGPGADAGPGTDFHAVEAGYVSITPLKTDLTNHQVLDQLSSWMLSEDVTEDMAESV